jgi:hypothetical protein
MTMARRLIWTAAILLVLAYIKTWQAGYAVPFP